MTVTLGSDVFDRYSRFSLYNSPYAAHDAGCAIDLYPEAGSTRWADAPPTAESPVAGSVSDVRTVSAPSKPYAAAADHLIVLETADRLVRVLHADPAVAPGDEIAVGDSLGTLVRSGFFAPWVDAHLHLGVRPLDANPYRAAGSLRLALDVPLRPVEWEGTGEVVETDETFAILDAPGHPDPGAVFAGLAVSVGGNCDRPAVLDGGVPHYEAGGVLVDSGDDTETTAPAADEAFPRGAPVTFLGTRVGQVTDGRTVAWDDVRVRVDGTPITGLSLFSGRERLGVKIVCPDHSLTAGETVTVGIDRA